jgi:hypothetical protein
MALFSTPEFNNAVMNCGSYASLMENKPLSIVVQSNPSFAAIVNSTQFKNAINNTAVLGFLQQNSGFLSNWGTVLTNGAFNVCMTNATGANALFSNPAFTGMVANPSFVLANQLGTLQNNSAFNALANSNQFFGLLNDPNFHSLASNPQFLAFLNGAAGYQMASNKPLDSAGLENLANQSQFESLANNTNFNPEPSELPGSSNAVQPGQCHSQRAGAFERSQPGRSQRDDHPGDRCQLDDVRGCHVTGEKVHSATDGTDYTDFHRRNPFNPWHPWHKLPSLI